jgi:hypothetical protein
MDASEKIIKFDSYDDLIEAINTDMAARKPLSWRYPIRFIMLNNFEIFRKLAQSLATLGVKPLNLEDLLGDNPDGWITSDELARAVKSCKERTIVTPFSGLVRFYKDTDFRGFFNEIMIHEDIDHQENRIYIPLIGLQNRFSNFLNRFARIEESAPAWAYLVEEHKTEVFLTQYKEDDKTFAHRTHICSLRTLRDWLRFWKNDAPQSQIICSSGPIYRRIKYSDPDNIFTFKYVQSPYEYIDSFLGVNIPFEYKEKESKLWERLKDDIIFTGTSVFSFSSFVLQRFNSQALTPTDIFSHWIMGEQQPYDRWLIKNFFLSSSHASDYPYFCECLKETTDYSLNYLLICKIAERIFYYAESATQKRYAEERKAIIQNGRHVFEEYGTRVDMEYVKGRLLEINENDTSLAIDLCTGVFSFEKMFIADWYAHRDQTGITLETVHSLYPELADYFSDIPTTVKAYDDWHNDYLYAYREAKLADEYTPAIQEVISTKNHDAESFYQWYHSFEESHNRLAELSSKSKYKHNYIVWIDALGAEFMPFISAMFEKGHNNFHILYSEITRCTIPSATAQNRYDGIQKYGEIDDIAHDKAGYKKYATLINQLNTLEEILNGITLPHYNEECNIAIVSDHGLSSFSRKVDSKKYQGKVEHDGRFINITGKGDQYSDSDYVVHVNENDGERYMVALTHASLGKKPIHEVHGGCTPEEVLVPFIILTTKKSDLILYDYKLLNNELEESDPVVTVNIMPQPSKIILSINGKDYQMSRSGSKWITHLDGLKEGTYKAIFTIPGGEDYTETIKIIGTGFGGNDFLNF